MACRHVIETTSYVFDDLRDLLAKATPPRSGDCLAGSAPTARRQMIAARMPSSTDAVMPLESSKG